MVGRLGCNRNNLDSCMQARKGYALVPLMKLLKSKKALFFSSATFIKGTSASLYCYVFRTAMFPELHLGYCCAACYCCAFFLLTPSRNTCFFCFYAVKTTTSMHALLLFSMITLRVVIVYLSLKLR